MSIVAAGSAPDSPLCTKLGSYLALTDAERDFLAQLERTVQHRPAKHGLLHQGEQYGAVRVLREGWVVRHKALTDGRRQIIGFVLPGGTIGIYSYLFKVADQSVTTLTGVKVVVFSLDHLAEIGPFDALYLHRIQAPKRLERAIATEKSGKGVFI